MARHCIMAGTPSITCVRGAVYNVYNKTIKQWSNTESWQAPASSHECQWVVNKTDKNKCKNERCPIKKWRAAMGKRKKMYNVWCTNLHTGSPHPLLDPPYKHSCESHLGQYTLHSHDKSGFLPNIHLYLKNSMKWNRVASL